MFGEEYFRGRKYSREKLLDCGFQEQAGSYQYEQLILDEQFRLLVTVNSRGLITHKVMDCDSGEEYLLYKIEAAEGTFVGVVRQACADVLQELARQCFEPCTFQSRQAVELLELARRQHGSEPEFLWPKFPGYAVLRRKDSGKWYAAVLNVGREKLGLPGEGQLEIIDLRLPVEERDVLIDNKKYFPGWHMNKRTWYTIILDGSVSMEELERRLEASYNLAKK